MDEVAQAPVQSTNWQVWRAPVGVSTSTASLEWSE